MFNTWMMILCGVCTFARMSSADPNTLAAFPCDHRFGAQATWSHDTDNALLNSFYYAEACAFKFNLAVTAFDGPFSQYSKHLTLDQCREACATGRVGFQVYFSTDRWRDPAVAESETDPAKKFPVIPDYYADAWTQAGVAAGFKVQAGQPKTKRFPNHGQQLYDISGGLYGYDVEKSRSGKTDVLTGLIAFHRSWHREFYGQWPSAASYRNGQTGAAYAMPKFFLGVRNSGDTGDAAYGKSTEQAGFLGNGDSGLPPAQMCSKPSTTRAGDMNLSRQEVLDHCSQLLRQVIATRGWYNDFIHWHTNPRFQTTLHDYYQSQRTILAGHDVVTLDYGDAVEHKALRDMAAVTSQFLDDHAQIQVTYCDPYEILPLEAIDIPLSVKVNVRGSSLQGRDITSPEVAGIGKLGPDVFIVDVPFHQRPETVTVHLRAADAPAYRDFSLPVVRKAALNGCMLTVETQPAARLAVFMNFDEQDPRKVSLIARSNKLEKHHKLDLSSHAESLRKCPLHIGVITEENQSILFGPVQKSAAAPRKTP